MRRIPASWSDADRRLYVGIAKRKKNEHVAGYTTIAIGCQLFYGLAKHLRDKQEPSFLEEDTNVPSSSRNECA